MFFLSDIYFYPSQHYSPLLNGFALCALSPHPIPATPSLSLSLSPSFCPVCPSSARLCIPPCYNCCSLALLYFFHALTFSSLPHEYCIFTRVGCDLQLSRNLKDLAHVGVWQLIGWLGGLGILWVVMAGAGATARMRQQVSDPVTTRGQGTGSRSPGGGGGRHGRRSGG